MFFCPKGVNIISFTFCYECPKYPCTRLKKLEERYSKNYLTSLIGNLAFIEAYGIEPFLKKEEERWACPSCGETLCIHRDFCTQCKTVYR